MSTIHAKRLESTQSTLTVEEWDSGPEVESAAGGVGLWFSRLDNSFRRWWVAFSVGVTAAVKVAVARADTGAAAAPARSDDDRHGSKRRIQVLRTISDRAPQPVRLIEVLPQSTPFVFGPDDMRSVWCLVVGAGRFTLEHAIRWVSETAQLNIQAGLPHLPSLIVVADARKLSRQELYRVGSNLEPHGAILVRWPIGSFSLDDALDEIVSQMSAGYGNSDFENGPRWGKRYVPDDFIGAHSIR